MISAAAAAGAGPSQRPALRVVSAAPERRDRDARRSQRDPGRLLGADGDGGPHSRARHGAVLPRHAGNPRLVPVVGDDHPDLHARRRSVRCRTRPSTTSPSTPPPPRSAAAGSARPASVQLHDADRQASEHELVSPRRPRRSADGHPAALQPAGPAGRRCCRTSRAQFKQHDWDVPALSAEGLARLKTIDPSSVQRFNAKVAATRAVANATAPVRVRLTTDWDKKRFPPSRDLVVFETTTAVPPEAWVRVSVSTTVPSPAGPEKPRGRRRTSSRSSARSSSTASAARAPARPTSATTCASAAGARRQRMRPRCEPPTSTSPGQPVPVAKPNPRQPRRGVRARRGRVFSLEDAGFDRQPPAQTFASPSTHRCVRPTVRRSATPGRARRELARAGVHQLWRRPRRLGAIAAALQLPFYARNLRDSDAVVAARRAARSDADDRSGCSRTTRRTQRTGVQRGAAVGGPGAAAQRHARPHPVARLRSVAGARHVRHRPGLGGDPRRRADRTRASGCPTATTSRPARRSSRSRTSGSRSRTARRTRSSSSRGSTTAAPVPAARVSIVNRKNQTVWSGTTGADGIAVAPKTPALRDPERWWRLSLRRHR